MPDPNITSVNEISAGRSRHMGRDWKRTYTRVWRVITASADVGALEVTEAVPILYGAYYTNKSNTEHDYGSFATEIRTDVETQAEDGLSWLVTVEYGPYDPTQFPESPLDKPPEIEWGFAPYERVVDADQNGKAVVNSAGDYFDPPVTMEDPRPVLTVVRNELSFDPSVADQYKNAVNSDVFLGIGPGKVKISRISGRRAWDQYLAANDLTPNGFYWVVTYEFEFNPDGWHKHILDQGMRQVVGGQQQQIVVGGSPVTSPALLNGSGQPLAPGGTPVYLEYVIYPEVPFEPLNITWPGP